ncbi:MAG: hypothetical protein M3R41_06215 [Pseudomonadota bacterium]|nr:hypothetical protein [Pseudomonadota bacterium]
MATIAERGVRIRPIGADGYERFLAIAAVALLVTVIAALARGYPHWSAVPGTVWAHLATIMLALALTPAMLLRRRGDTRHRLLGKIWVAAMFLTAAITLFVRQSHPGHFSIIHLISLYVLIAAPLIWWTAHTRRVTAHRRQVRGMVTGALLVAGFFTLPFGRMLGGWLFG